MDITHNLAIKASSGTIYNAVASQLGIQGWWCKDSAVGENEGETSLLKFDKQGTIVEMGFKTVSLNPNEEVVWECVENANPAWLGTQIITLISVSDDGCQVQFSHANFDEKWAGQEAFTMTEGTWGHFMTSLVAYCEGGEGQPW